MEYLYVITLLSSYTKMYIMKEYNKFCSKIFKVTKHTACTHLWIGYNLSRKDCTIFEVYSLLFSICHLCLWLFAAEVNQLLRSESHYIRVVNYFPLYDLNYWQSWKPFCGCGYKRQYSRSKWRKVVTVENASQQIGTEDLRKGTRWNK